MLNYSNHNSFPSTCYSDTGYYGMDWFDAMQCCYYQVPGPSDWVFLYLFLSMVMSRNLWAKRNMTRSRSTSPSVRIFILSIFNWKYVGANQAERTQSSANGGDKQNAWWLGGTDLHSEVRSQIIQLLIQKWLWYKKRWPHNCPGKLDLDVRGSLVICTLGGGWVRPHCFFL